MHIHGQNFPSVPPPTSQKVGSRGVNRGVFQKPGGRDRDLNLSSWKSKTGKKNPLAFTHTYIVFFLGGGGFGYGKLEPEIWGPGARTGCFCKEREREKEVSELGHVGICMSGLEGTKKNIRCEKFMVVGIFFLMGGIPTYPACCGSLRTGLPTLTPRDQGDG